MTECIISPALINIINECIDQNIFPNARISPLPKVENQSECDNYSRKLRTLILSSDIDVLTRKGQDVFRMVLVEFYVAKGRPTSLKVFNCKCTPPFWKLENNIFSSLLFFLYSFLSLQNLTKFSVKCYMHAWRFLSCCQNLCLALISQILELSQNCHAVNQKDITNLFGQYTQFLTRMPK